MENQEEKRSLNKKATIAGFFFIFIQLLVKGITFITTPLYTRLVSTAQYGDIGAYESALLVMVPLFSLSLHRSIARAKFDYRNELPQYAASVLSLSFLVIGASALIATLFFRDGVMSYMDLNLLMYVYMILYLFAHTAVFYFQVKERHMLRYKKSVILTSLMMIPATIISILMLRWGNQKGMYDSLVDLRVIGFYTPQIIGGLIAAFAIYRDAGFSVDSKYWKYALAFSLPLIPETVSIQIMNQADKLMIKKMAGSEFSGLFGLAATISYIIWIIEDATWNSLAPWLFEKLDRKETEDIQKPWDFVTFLFGYFSWALVMLGPELIYILGGSRYRTSVWLVGPMVTGTLIRFFSFIFTSVQRYQKKTGYSVIGTICGMFCNIILNYICINRFGYQSAAYTTIISYFVMLVIQGWMEKKVCGTRCVSFRKMILVSLFLLLINESSMLLYNVSGYIRIVLFLIVSLFVAWKLLPDVKKLLEQLR